ncbi:hypothetical protein K2173_003513 [Erythroxylum novogranatense]|uniref:HTH myb-type domain-containing protein n=1 Tax=Erythroxylum novogranatense TaxID=1862640 RepID=A0AAV8TAC8_9ROSI|nr:hypothetical protein K2173_003513 [Erythroxylum novogranatense]
MLAVSSLRSTTFSSKDENQEQMESFRPVGNQDFSELADKNLLESIDFDNLFVDINAGDVLPDLEMDPEILAEFSVSPNCDQPELNTSVSNGKVEDNPRKEEEEKISSGSSWSGLDSSLSTRGEDQVVSKRDESSWVMNPVPHKGDKGRKSSTQTKHNQGKKKVDWTPELHGRFVQAVELLGVDKAVPSRILELMGIDCLTRHNIASHLQKYRSHRKHLLAREAEAVGWSQRRQMYGTAAATVGGDMLPWQVPTIGFPPVTLMQHPFRPLHVWGHPSMDQSPIHIWPKHLTPSPSPPPPQSHSWAPLPRNPSYWHQHHRVPSGLTPGTPCLPQSLPATRFATPPVPVIPSHATYKVDPADIGAPTSGQSGHHHPTFDFHPSKESIDAAIGDALSKPWQPLPLKLKAPSLDSVLVELQRRGVTKIPPTAC